MIKGWRTLGLALLIAGLGVLQAFDFTTVVPQDRPWSGAVLMAIGVAIAALRYVTDTAVGKKA